MPDEIAKLYLDYEGKRYRVKVFALAVGIERQPGGENVLLAKTDYPDAAQVYNRTTGGWNYGALFRLLRQYPVYTVN